MLDLLLRDKKRLELLDDAAYQMLGRMESIVEDMKNTPNDTLRMLVIWATKRLHEDLDKID